MKQISLNIYLNYDDILEFEDDVSDEEIEKAVEDIIDNNLQIDWSIIEED